MKRTWLIGGLAALLLAACNSHSDLVGVGGTTLSATAADTAESAALSSADATAEDIDLMNAAELSIDGGGYDLIDNSAPLASSAPSFSSGSDSTRFAFWSFAKDCTYSAITGRFTCPALVKNGLTLTRSAAFLDAGGTAMSKPDSLTASANFQLAVSGVHSALTGADTISRSRNMTATGLLGKETQRTWNGTGSRSDAGFRSDSGVTRTYHTTDNVTFTNVLVKLPRLTNPWPISGTVVRQVAGSGSATRNGTTRTFTLSRIVTITFNGTRTVPMTVGTTEFTLDLLTGKATKV